MTRRVKVSFLGDTDKPFIALFTFNNDWHRLPLQELYEYFLKSVGLSSSPALSFVAAATSNRAPVFILTLVAYNELHTHKLDMKDTLKR